MADNPIIDVRGVTKTFTLQGQEVHALGRTDLAIAKGEFVCLIGASGCGKSTLLRLIAGFETPTSGEVRMWGLPVAEPGPSRGMVFQDYALFPWLTVRENIAFGPRARAVESRANAGRRRIASSEMGGLQRFADAWPHQLSGGNAPARRHRTRARQRRRGGADGRALGALDAMTRERLQEELLDIWQRTKLTVVFVTHAIEEAIHLGDRVGGDGPRPRPASRAKNTSPSPAPATSPPPSSTPSAACSRPNCTATTAARLREGGAPRAATKGAAAAAPPRLAGPPRQNMRAPRTTRIWV